jgi:uncharacterized membrane protein
MVKVEQVDIPQHYYEGGITHFTREDDVEGEGIWIVLHCSNGGRISILTQHPLVWVDPQEH